jgi:hypothetical protein
MSPVTRKRPSSALKAVEMYLFQRYEEAKAKRAKEKLYTPSKFDQSLIPSWVMAGGEQDSKGSYLRYFAEPFQVGEKKITGMKWQANQGDPDIDPDKAEDFAKRKHLEDQVTNTTIDLSQCSPEQVRTIVNGLQGLPILVAKEWLYDEFYTLYQRKLITKAELNSLITTPEVRYSLVSLED